MSDFLSFLAREAEPPLDVSRWYCDRPDCDGEPHGEHWHWCPHPEGDHPAHVPDCRHARAAQRPPQGEWFVLFYLMGRGWGKLLDVNTPIPTPDGWSTLGELRVGSKVFDEGGRPCTVTATFDALPDKAYRLTFSDGSFIDACSEHQWVTWTAAARKAFGRNPEAGREYPEDWPAWRSWRSKGHGRRDRIAPHLIARAYRLVSEGHSWREAARLVGETRHRLWRHAERLGELADREGPRVRTTQEIVDSFTYGPRGDLNHSIPVCGALKLPDADLPVDPYVLGAWLGDGASRSGGFTGIDPAIWRQIEAAGYRVAHHRRRQQHQIIGLVGQLRRLGVLGDKHVPVAYLRASAEQRLALLQGLMDTDGYISPVSGQAEFCSTNERLADAVVELARSLGQLPVKGKGRAMLAGIDHGPKFRVKWRPTIQVFRLERKAALWKRPGAQALRSQQRMIVSAEPIAPQPMRCITVDSFHSMYLAGEAMIPTHNSRAAAEWIVHSATHQPPAEWAVIARNAADVRKNCRDMSAGIVPCAERHGVLKQYNRHEEDIYLKNGAIIHAISADKPDKLRGFNLAGAWADELCAWRFAAETWDYGLMPALRAGSHPRVIVTTTPKPIPLLKRLVDEARAEESKPLEKRSKIILTGSTFDNAKNLAENFIREMRETYEGTRIGRQELMGELLFEVSGALFTPEMIEAARITPSELPELQRVVVAVDPAGTYGEDSDETGIVVCAKGEDGHGYVLADRSCRVSPHEWATIAAAAYEQYGADAIAAEKNMGHGLVEDVIRSVAPYVRYIPIQAQVGKRLRAEPVAALYQQGRIHHVGTFPRLEDQLTEWRPDSKKSPDRMDALVHGFTELGLVRFGVGHGWIEYLRKQVEKDQADLRPPRQAGFLLGQEPPKAREPSHCDHRWLLNGDGTKNCVFCGWCGGCGHCHHCVAAEAPGALRVR